MKINLPLIICALLLTAPGCNSQKKTITPYGYYRFLTPGKIPSKDIYEDGTIKIAGSKSAKNYYVYARINRDPDKKIAITDLWLEGIHFTASMEEMDKPSEEKVIFDDLYKPKAKINPQKVTPVFMVLPVDNTEKMGLSTPPLPEKFKKDEVVIGYDLGNKKKYVSIKKLKQLPRDVAQ